MAATESKHFRFEYDQSLFNPLLIERVEEEESDSKRRPEIPVDARYIRPLQGKSWQAVKQQLDESDESCCKLIFIARHGHSKHNELQEGWPRLVFDKFISQNPEYANSALTETGKTQVKRAGRMLVDELKANAVFPELWPGSFYTSPLKRCIATAVAISTASHRPEQKETSLPPPTVHVMDNLREWLGWNHNEQNDTRGTRAEIDEHATKFLQVKLSFPLSFPEADEMFMQDPLEEVWVQVDQRWEQTLNFVFETDPNRVICITGNNRSIQSGLRVIGHSADDEELNNGFGIMNMKNGAMVAFLVRRHTVDASEVDNMRLKRESLRKKEERIIGEKKAEDDKKAEEEVIEMTSDKFESLLELLDPVGKQMVLAIRGRTGPEDCR